MALRADSILGLERFTGSPVVRSAVNLGFQLDARLRCAGLAQADAVRIQERHLWWLVRKARQTRFGCDHGFSVVRSVADFQQAVPLRTYETLWAADLAMPTPYSIT